MSLDRFAHILAEWLDRDLARWQPAILVLVGVLLGVWLLTARGLTGYQLALWLAVPAFLVAGLVCIMGPGWLFPKHPFQGPVLVRVSVHRALTALDLPGLACAVAATVLAVRLVRERITRH